MAISDQFHRLLMAVLFLSGAHAVAMEPASELLVSARDQDWAAVHTLLGRDDGVEVNATQADGATALAWAVHWDAVDAAQALLDADADPNLGNDYGVTPLFLAVTNHSRVMTGLLLDRGADTNATLWSGMTPLMTAARTGQTTVAELLLRHGADVNARESRRGQTALMLAISFGYPDTASFLIEQGADVNASSLRLAEEDFSPMVVEGYTEDVVVTPRGGFTPLMFAARTGDLATSRLLLESGAELDAVQVENGSPLVIAAANGHEDLALFLLARGADPSIADGDGLTALHYAMRDGLKILHGYAVEEVRSVCGWGGEENRCTPADALTDAEWAMLDNPELGLYIREPRPDPRKPLRGGNMLDLAERLLARGADPDVGIKHPPPRLRMAPADKPEFFLEGATPFFLATAALDLAAMEMLLEAGADPLAGTRVKREEFYRQTRQNHMYNQIAGDATTLMVAVGLGRTVDMTPSEEEKALQAAERLVAMGADVNAVSASGWTPLHAAAFIGADSLIEFLVAQGARVNVQNGCGQTPLSLAEGMNTKGLTSRPMPHPDTAELLRSLGAGSEPPTPAAGECVLGRGGLEVDLELKKHIQRVKQQREQAQAQP